MEIKRLAGGRGQLFFSVLTLWLMFSDYVTPARSGIAFLTIQFFMQIAARRSSDDSFSMRLTKIIPGNGGGGNMSLMEDNLAALVAFLQQLNA